MADDIPMRPPGDGYIATRKQDLAAAILTESGLAADQAARAIKRRLQRYADTNSFAR